MDNVFTEAEYVKSDGEYVRMIAGMLVRELLWQAPMGYVIHSDGTLALDSEFVRTGMILVLADGSRLPIAVYGDVNSDGNVTASDARLALRGAVGLEDCSVDSVYYVAANVNRRDGLSASDARIILRTAVGLDWVGDWIAK